MIVLSMLAGLLVGCLGFFPGLHLGTLFVLAAPFLLTHGSPLSAAVFIAAAGGVGLCAHRLAQVFHPVVGTSLASADPAQRLAAAGKGLHALGILLQGVVVAALMAGTLAFIVVGTKALRVDVIRPVESLINVLAVPVLLLWFGYTLYRSASPLGSLLAGILLGGLGFIAFHHPAFSSNAHVMTPLLAGVFALPVLMTTLKKGKGTLPTQQDLVGVTPNFKLWSIGSLMGIATGFLAGLGAGSLASLAESQTANDEDYLALSGTAEAANDLFALVLVLAIGSTRSGEAVALHQVLPTVDVPGMLTVLLALTVALVLGILMTQRVASGYVQLVTRIPLGTQARVLLLVVLGTVWWQTGLLGFLLMLTGWLVATYARKVGAPNQVNFSVLVVPVALFALGLAGPLANTLFGS